MHWVRWFLAGVFSLASIAAAEGKLQVVASFLPAYSLTSEIAGEHAEVKHLLAGSGSLHDYQLTPRDMRQLSAADLIVINGLGMESFLDRALVNLGAKAGGKVVEMSEGLATGLIAAPHAHDHGAAAHDHRHDFNPHIWLDPLLAAHAVTNISRALQKADPTHAAEYRKNAAELVGRLHELDREIGQKTAGVKEVPFVTYHNAFPYFVRRYGLKLVGVVEEVPEVTPSPREMRRLLQTIRESGAKALFTEPKEASRLAEQIAKDTGLKLAELDPLETGEPRPNAYVERMRQNVENLVQALK